MKLSSSILSRTLWFFDYDGSLCPHQEVWEERAYDPKDIISILKAMTPKVQNIFWNTGRRVESLGAVDPAFLHWDGFFVQGSVFWNSKNSQQHELGPLLPVDSVENWVRILEKKSKIRFEIKPTSMRIAPFQNQSMSVVRAALKSIGAPPGGWTWHVGLRGAELLAEGFHKGYSVRHVFERDRAAYDASIPVVVGDDEPDRFAVEAALGLGGFALLVGEGCGWITKIPHKPWQIYTFQEPKDVQKFIKSII